MNNYYRITCNQIGIYEYYKSFIWNNIENPSEFWDEFKKSDQVNWLKVPSEYNNKNKRYCSYFTEKGYQMFISKTLPKILNHIEKDLIKIEKVESKNLKIVYEDEYQILVEIDTINYSREFCSKVKELATQYNLSFFLVTEGASVTSNNGSEAVKHARDCHIEWEKSHNYDPYEDWSKIDE